ncbi:retrovirus-related Pol polyprotein from transposon 17.6 [Trichonephila clavipes]|nr:retrovirus-related Pol polyprotein from transposon 17.6 [Trichonephila clavipes]
MALLSKGKKIDLYTLASELRVSVTLEDKIIDLREKITSCTFFQNNEQFVKEMLDNIVDERKSLEVEALNKIEREDKCLADQIALELEKLKLQAQNPPASVGNSSQMDSNPMRNTGNPKFRKSHSFKVEKNVSGNHNSAFANPSYMPARNTNTGFHPPISCYGCGNPGFIKSKCPKCSLKKESASVNAIHMFTCLTSPVALLDIEVYEATDTVCADTGASQSVGGELMFKFLRNRGQKFSEFHLAMCLADGQQSTSLVQKATVPITVGGRTFQIDLIFLPHAKGNRTLLGVDFLKTSGIVMDMRNNFWYFGDKPSFRKPFSKDVPLPVDDSPVEINSSSCPTNSIPSEIPLHTNTVDEEICELKTIIIDFPTRTANELRTEQLKDLELKKIIDCFENPNKRELTLPIGLGEGT